MRELLKPSGSIYIHLDWHAVHYVKVELDRIFGVRCFRNEIIWKRTSAHSSAKRYGPVHDVLLLYTKSDVYTWNQQYQPYDKSYLTSHYRSKDDQGRAYTLSDLTASGIRHGESGLSWRGFDVTAKGRRWSTTPSELDQLDTAGRIYWPTKSRWPRYKRYLNEVKGTPIQDVWTDIDPLNSQTKARLGYPTQKPDQLLERIIRSCSNRNDVVAHFFCGCGTAVAVAQKLGRHWIGCDVSPTALRIVKERMERLGAPTVFIENYPRSEAEMRAMKPFEFQNYVMGFIQGTQSPRLSGDFGIDGYTLFHRLPVQVKQQDHIGRQKSRSLNPRFAVPAN